MTTLIFANNAQATLNGPITNVALSLTLATGTGALFPNPSAGQAFKITLIDALTGLINEIVLCTARAGDVCTIVRAQEDTTAKSWLGGDLAANLVTAGSAAAFLQQANARIRLAASTTYYVSNAGSDSTGDGSLGLPWATIQFAADYIKNNVDVNGQSVTVSVANGTYAAFAVAGPFVGGNSGVVQFVGNTTTPASCLISTTSATCITADIGAVFAVGGFKMQSTGANAMLASSGAQIIIAGAVDFGACANGYHFNAAFDGGFNIGSNYTISGGARGHMIANNSGAVIRAGAFTATLTGTPAFSVATAAALAGATIVPSSLAFSGAATGVRYSVSLNGVINTGGAGANYFPGNSAGTTATGGQYA